MNLLESLLAVAVAAIATFIGIIIIQRIFIAGFDLYYKRKHNKKTEAGKRS